MNSYKERIEREEMNRDKIKTDSEQKCKENKVERKRRKEQRMVEEMIALYCRGNHEAYKKGQLCPVCQEVADYAKDRSARCPFMEQKTFCANCQVHCYKPAMREEIRKIMRYSGPRMLFHHPGMAVWHLICSQKEKKNQKIRA